MVGKRVMKKVKVKVSRGTALKKMPDSRKVKSKKTTKKINSAVLFSGGKDSGLALYYALKYTNVKCLIIMQSKNTESYMFHTPNIKWAKVQAKATGIPFIVQDTQGVKEDELKDLKTAIKKAKTRYKVQSIVTGAIESVYQASRVQAITNDLGMECFNPLWQKDQLELLDELIKERFDIVIVGVFGYGLDKLIGRHIDSKFIDDVRLLKEKLKINPAGEGGEYESFILNAPYFVKPLNISSSKITKDDSGGIVLDILELNR